MKGTRWCGSVDEMAATMNNDQKPAVVDDFAGMLQLNSTNFDLNVATDATFVMFYAPWCGHCHKLKPTWIDLSKENFSSTTEIPVKIAYVDGTKNKDLRTKYQIKGYPTLILFVDGTPHTEYKRDRSKDALRGYVISELKKTNKTRS